MRKIVFLIIPLTFFLGGCRMILPELKYKPIVLGRYYFPSQSEDFEKLMEKCRQEKGFLCDLKEPEDSLRDLTNKWYSAHLYSLGLPRLYDKTGEDKIIVRFIEIPTWGYSKSYQVQKHIDKLTIRFDMARRQGAYNAGRRIKHNKKRIDNDKWELITSKMDSIDYWQIMTNDTNMTLDGSEWIFEALIDDKYHFVARNTPGHYGSKDYAELCKLIKTIYESED